MRQIVMMLVAVAVMGGFMACGSNTESDNEQQGAAGEKKEAVETLSVDDLMAHIDNEVGKEVVLKGMVDHVCKHGGKRLHLMGSDDANKIRVESGAEITQFDRELEGSEIMVTGKVMKQVIDEAFLAQREEELKSGTAEHEEHDEEHADEHHEGAMMLHGVNSLEQVAELRKQIAAKEDNAITSYWIEGISYKTFDESCE